MTPSNLLEAIEEAKRFIKKAEFLIAVSDCRQPNYGRMYVDIDIFPKEQGSVKRSSMDLTRSLAKLRNRK
jgi:hypothetical protein